MSLTVTSTGRVIDSVYFNMDGVKLDSISHDAGICSGLVFKTTEIKGSTEVTRFLDLGITADQAKELQATLTKFIQEQEKFDESMGKTHEEN